MEQERTITAEHHRIPENLDYGRGCQDVLRCVTNLVRNIFGVDIAAVSLIEDQRQRFLSIQGLALTSLPLEASFCRAPWREGRTVVIPDTVLDAEFQNHPLVTGQPAFRSYAGVPLRNSMGDMIGIICAIHGQPRTFTEREIAILNDLATLAAIELELHEDATVDSLTGILTRRAFFRESARLHEAALRRDLPLAVIMFDVDHFKLVNDRYGHAAGDRALESIARACRGRLRDRDLLGRLGGEEFGVVLAATLQEAEDAAEGLRATIAALPFRFGDEAVRVTASFGVAAVVDGVDALSVSVSRADAALYAAKAQGRNRSVTAELTTLRDLAAPASEAARNASA